MRIGELRVEVLNLKRPDVTEGIRKNLSVSDGTVYLFSDEWESRNQQCMGFVRARAGVFDRRVGARQCDVREVPKQEAVAFLDEFHIQGANKLGLVYFGLYMTGELVGLLSLGRHSRQIAKNRVVLDRMCFRHGVQIIGGSSRLMRIAKEWAVSESYDEMLTFSDNRLTDGSLYRRLGFELEREMKPDYCYVKDGRRFSKQSQKKSASKCPDSMTEREWASFRGMERIYDAGKKRWVLNLRPEGHKTRNDLSSERCAKMHQAGVFHQSHIRGSFWSDKNSASVYFGSSYELRCMFLLESNDDVRSFRRCNAFEGENGWRNPDLWVEFEDGSYAVWEVKPSETLSHPAVQKQVCESKRFANEKCAEFRVWTEADSGLISGREITNWARRYLSENGYSKHLEQKKIANRAKRRRYYERRIAGDKVEVWCEYCHETHNPLRLTYERNVKRNGGAYICGRYGGYLSGKRTKSKKSN